LIEKYDNLWLDTAMVLADLEQVLFKSAETFFDFSSAL